MLDINTNTIAVPEAEVVPSFDDLKSEFVNQIVADIETSNPDLAAAIRESLNNPAEFGTVIVEGAVRVLQDRYRYVNDQALQMLAIWARDSNLDAKLSDRGLTRKVIDPGDPDAYPVIEPTYESDDEARQRFMLWPYSLATTGTRLGYRFHALSIDERPDITIDKTSDTELVVTYTFTDDSNSTLIKDAKVKGRGSNSGQVDVYLLSYESDNGVASQATIDTCLAYLNRDDIAQETDELFGHSADIVEYALSVTVYGSTQPGGLINQADVEAALQAYADERHKLETRISVSNVYAICEEVVGVNRAEIDLAADIVCDHTQAPYCTSINVTVNYE
ncbi:TPA: baseplate J/gp47 family protein [Vibrio parahaemolyticus]|nr:baseplate J/gp47 family protein [Vibrio parahaemolyticus]